jgi:acetyl esterase
MRLVLLVAVCLVVEARTLRDVEYAQVGGESLRMDAAIPDGTGADGSGRHAALILVHGGAWVTGDKQRNVQPLFAPLEEAGIAWFSINYRLARGDDPAALISLEGLAALARASDDVRKAVVFVRAHAEEYGIDPERIVLLGESAGAHLASMAALRAPRAEVRGVVAFYSPSDLVRLVETSPRIPDALRRAVKGTPLEALLLPALRQLSPQTYVDGGAPPFFMIHGTADTLVPVEQSERMCGALQSAGAACELLTVEGAAHGMLGWERNASMTTYKPVLLAWLKRLLD